MANLFLDSVKQHVKTGAAQELATDEGQILLPFHTRSLLLQPCLQGCVTHYPHLHNTPNTFWVLQ